jgi:hypothetical protein
LIATNDTAPNRSTVVKPSSTSWSRATADTPNVSPAGSPHAWTDRRIVRPIVRTYAHPMTVEAASVPTSCDWVQMSSAPASRKTLPTASRKFTRLPILFEPRMASLFSWRRRSTSGGPSTPPAAIRIELTAATSAVENDVPDQTA